MKKEVKELKIAKVDPEAEPLPNQVTTRNSSRSRDRKAEAAKIATKPIEVPKSKIAEPKIVEVSKAKIKEPKIVEVAKSKIKEPKIVEVAKAKIKEPKIVEVAKAKIKEPKIVEVSKSKIKAAKVVEAPQPVIEEKKELDYSEYVEDYVEITDKKPTKAKAKKRDPPSSSVTEKS